jgi:hypothetical protein
MPNWSGVILFVISLSWIVGTIIMFFYAAVELNEEPLHERIHLVLFWWLHLLAVVLVYLWRFLKNVWWAVISIPEYIKETIRDC